MDKDVTILKGEGDMLKAWDRISRYWQEQPADKHLQILVQYPVCA
jgi:hypothetical protein